MSINMFFMESWRILYFRYFSSYVVFISDCFLPTVPYRSDLGLLVCNFRIISVFIRLWCSFLLSHLYVVELVLSELVFDVLISMVSNSNFSFLISCISILNGSVFLPFYLGLRTFLDQFLIFCVGYVSIDNM